MDENVGGQRAVRLGVDGHAVDGGRRHGFQINGPVDAAVVPVIAAAFGGVDGGVGRVVIDGHLQQIVAGLQQPGDVVFEAVIPALVHGAGGLAVDAHAGVGHDAFEDDEDLLARPVCGRGESALVMALDLGPGVLVVAAVGVDAEALEFPVGGDADGGPFIGVSTGGAHEVPLDGVALCLCRKGRRSRSRQPNRLQRRPRGPLPKRPGRSCCRTYVVSLWVLRCLPWRGLGDVAEARARSQATPPR